METIGQEKMSRRGMENHRKKLEEEELWEDRCWLGCQTTHLK
jgi:hypothetical protein